jgi:hypothetical protein
MTVKELRISITLPEDLSIEDSTVQKVRRAALEGAVLTLWQAGRMSTRRAAKRLGLTYRAYLDLLTDRDIPVLSDDPDEDRVKDLVSQVVAERRVRG